MLIFTVYFVITLSLDLITKSLTVLMLRPYQSFSLIGQFFQFTYVQNHGAAFGILPGRQPFLILVSLFVACGVVWFLYKERPTEKLTLAALGFLMGGTVGNLLDRALKGYVVDFIDIGLWPTFNVADIAINIGVLLLVWQVLCADRTDVRPKRKKKPVRKEK